jgi:hypothetical protein
MPDAPSRIKFQVVEFVEAAADPFRREGGAGA